MLKIQRKAAAPLVFAFVFTAVSGFSAFAGGDANAKSATRHWHPHTAARLSPSKPLYNQRSDGAAATRRSRTVDDSCDLPSAGCESYLAN
jgi:hypothetical protein